MSAELCRRPNAFMRYLKNRRDVQVSGFQISSWESRKRNNLDKGEPMSAGRVVDITPHQEVGAESADSTTIVPQEVVVYSMGVEKPTLGEEFHRAGITMETINPHHLLDDPMSYQDQRLSEALKRERQGTQTPRWQGYLRDVRAYLAIEHRLAFEADNIV